MKVLLLMAAARPVIVRRGGEFPQLLEFPGWAVIVDFEVTASDAALGDRARHAELAARGRDLIESELNWDVIGDQLERVVQRAAFGELQVSAGGIGAGR